MIFLPEFACRPSRRSPHRHGCAFRRASPCSSEGTHDRAPCTLATEHSLASVCENLSGYRVVSPRRPPPASPRLGVRPGRQTLPTASGRGCLTGAVSHLAPPQPEGTWQWLRTLRRSIRQSSRPGQGRPLARERPEVPPAHRQRPARRRFEELAFCSSPFNIRLYGEGTSGERVKLSYGRTSKTRAEKHNGKGADCRGLTLAKERQSSKHHFARSREMMNRKNLSSWLEPTIAQPTPSMYPTVYHSEV